MVVLASALALAAMQPLPPASIAQNNTCLLAGPSRSLLAARLEKTSEGFVMRQLPGQAWPFASGRVTLSANQANHSAQGSDTGSGLSARLSLLSAESGGLSMTISRGGLVPGGLPILVGSCAASGGAAGSQYLDLVHNTAFAPPRTATEFRELGLVASANCQVVSAVGWVSRFSVVFPQNSATIVIRPEDQHLWHEPTIESPVSGSPFPEPRGWLHRGFELGSMGRPDRGSPYNTIWVFITPDGQQGSATVSFIGHRSGDSVDENVTGICADFAREGTSS
jgi:hypothetical protein